MIPEVLPVRQDELAAYIDALSSAFLERPDIDRAARELWPLWQEGRTWAARDDGRICGTFRSWPTELTVPGGGRVPGSAIAGVTVLPTHRRRGILRAMVAVEHGAIRDHGEVFGLLHASEYPIYGRFGYAAATREATWTLDAGRTGFHGASTGSVELVRPDVTTRAAMVEVFEAWRVRQPGEIRRRANMWDFELGLREPIWSPGWKGFVVLHRADAGAVDGYARYHVEERWEQRQPRNALVVDDFHALDEAANAAIWRFLAETDWVAEVRAGRRSPSDRLPWLLTNARAAALSEVGDSLWVRIFDVPRALEARTYAASGRLVLEVVDGEAPGGKVRVVLDATPDGATCRPTGETPDLTVGTAALAAAYLGGVRLRDAVVGAGADEHRPGALLAAEALLRQPDEPWCSTFF
jgi:predicted acetyltransferase